MENLPENEFDDVMSKVLDYFAPYFRYDYQVFRPRYGFFGLISTSEHRIIKFCNDSLLGRFFYVDTNDKERIFFYSEDRVFPPFIIAGLSRWKAEYEHSSFNHHFDTDIYNRMCRENYSLYPKLE